MMKKVAGDNFHNNDVTRKQKDLWRGFDDEKRGAFEKKAASDKERYEKEVEANPRNKFLKGVFDNPADESKRFVPRRPDGTIIAEPSKSLFLYFSKLVRPKVSTALKAAAGSEMKQKDVSAKINQLWSTAALEKKQSFEAKWKEEKENFETEVERNAENAARRKAWESAHPEIMQSRKKPKVSRPTSPVTTDIYIHTYVR